MASILGSVFGPQSGGRQNFKVTGRKIARGSIVSARTRQKFSMPLVFHGFAAPQALVLHARRTFMATHVLELGRPSVAGPVFARVFGPQKFLDPKLVSRKITFFDPLKEQKVWKTCEG